jgi:hypothetical protein
MKRPAGKKPASKRGESFHDQCPDDGSIPSQRPDDGGVSARPGDDDIDQDVNLTGDQMQKVPAL